ncbi:MAG: DegT/DnrJ/EryC1/StrS family aminotransferase [Synergistaceae bacterium]|nr:DegT/DnrJ/EryC1/StrS family aminotransferase [Synergistaceae bacterium]
MTVPILDLKRSFSEIKPEVFTALERVFSTQSFILGREVEMFEKHCETYLELPKGSCIGCASGTDALLLALMASDIQPGDEVITTPFTFFATSGAIARLGGVPVFVDVDPVSYCIDLDAAMKKITSKTKVFLPVHLFGQMCALEEVIPQLHAKGIKIVEDAAQAFGACRRVGDELTRAGCVGDMGCYSFFPTKNLGGCGDGGMVVAREPETADRLRRLRVHGSGRTYYHDEIGINSRLDGLQAAILDIKLRHLDEWNEQRRKAAEYYKLLFKVEGLHEFVSVPEEMAGNVHIWHQYVVRVKERRDELMAWLEERGVSVRVYYPLSLHLQPCFRYLGYHEGDFPVSEKLTREVIALPIFPGITSEEQEELVKGIAEFFTKA